jgi:DNA-binding winged helix-turn-helix (wHTH) protein
MSGDPVSAPPPVRFRFGPFVLSPRQRVLYRDGTPVPLIPRYFDLLSLLVARRRDAVSKDAIFAQVWNDVVVSDGALAQAVRTVRRTLGDDSRDPRFIRTVSRHGYQFVYADVTEERDDGAQPPPAPPARADATDARLEPLVDTLLAASGPTGRSVLPDAARDAAERLHALDTARAVARLVERPDHAPAIAVMREARWDVPGAGPVPLLRDPEAPRAILALVRLRLDDARGVAARRWVSAAASGAIGGSVAGAVGGLVLALSPASQASLGAPLALAVVGAAAGGVGAAGIGAGLAAAEVLARSRRAVALVACGAIAGGLVAGLARVLLKALLASLFGLRLATPPGAVEGLALGAAAGLGYAVATPQPAGGGLAAPTGLRRVQAAITVALSCAVAAAALAQIDHLMVGGLIHDIARQSRDAQLVLAPLGRLIGEPGFGPVTRTLLSALEGGTFGGALCWGLTRRPRS